WLKRNTIDQAKDYIHQHYDLGNELYQLFLAEEMLYSSALFTQPELSREQAQRANMQRLWERVQRYARGQGV
ncbi:class I SAM-dependent methyltransferase, partial [Vibrio cholerae O1]|uniref:SAM-dependent methyltransferase n=1 Tax=Vibrio cholerae TaxID=666 RepID=UPI001C1110C4